MDRTKEQGRGGHLSFARGGPLYVPNLVGPLTIVPEFKESIVQELQCLQAELLAAGEFEDELSIDELKVFTEEELLEKALEALEGNEDGVNLAPAMGNCSVPMESTASTMSGKEIVPLIISSNEGESSETRMSSNSSTIEAHRRDQSEEDGEHNKKNSKKRGRLFDRDTRASELDVTLIQKMNRMIAKGMHLSEEMYCYFLDY